MMGFLALMAAQVVTPPPPAEEEIIVTGRRMSEAHYAMKINRDTKTTQCWITRSSGDKRLDWQVCEIAKVCATVVPLKRKVVQTCMRDRKAEFLRTYRPQA